jgi:hypothetical protein
MKLTGFDAAQTAHGVEIKGRRIARRRRHARTPAGADRIVEIGIAA